MTIGNFSDTLNFQNDTLCIKPNTDWQDKQGTSYYYIDGISLREVNELEIPNFITPNSDGNNDIIDFNIYKKLKNANLKVVNRWGIVVYNNNSLIWNGLDQNGCKLLDGVYFYLLYNDSELISGSISIFN